MDVQEPQPDFALLPDFFSDEDLLLDFPKSFGKSGTMQSDTDICFPAEFPYDLCSSPAGSAESDEEEYLASLTRRLTLSAVGDTPKSISSGQNQFESWDSWLLSGSRQQNLPREGNWSGLSTGSSNVTPNGPSQISSPTTPLGFRNDSWDLILQAAAEVARLKMNAGEESLMGHRRPGPPSFPPFPPVPRTREYIEPHLTQARPQSRAVFGGAGPYPENGMYGAPVMGGVSCDGAVRGWPVIPLPGGGVKRERAGTGVFLPRRYGNANNAHHCPKDSRSKAGYCTTARAVHGPHNNIQDFNGPVQPQSGADFVSDYEVMRARRYAAMLVQNKRNLSPEVMLPQEWTY
ncbi:unnamed protein product [Cuscuta epithymum]|uniref:Uncharacterized protein n=1 Tax=Cuscuta epithymum TaxID=186058 RepID=A0AAV0FRR5_9ASTE|nr:unnamed protein product [Cuscuta epithymum]CAH9138328.1 unnamed protein product [Cuscuta epithymum]